MKDNRRMVKPSHAVMPEDDDEDSIEAVLGPGSKNSEMVLEKNQRRESEPAETGTEKMDDDMGK
jgi:hypothetical protein